VIGAVAFDSGLDRYLLALGGAVARSNERASRVAPERAAGIVRAVRDSLTLAALRRLLAELDSSPPTALLAHSDAELLDRLARECERGEHGRLTLWQRQPPTADAATFAPIAQQDDPSGAGEAAEPDWIELELCDQDGRPLARQRFELELPDGTVRRGRTNAHGFARLTCILPGTCELSFPDLDASAWDRA